MRFKQFYLTESIHDKYLFKAIFIVGGPGSGKSFISSLMFEGLPIKFVNSDIYFEKLLKKYNLPIKIDNASKDYIKQTEVREKSKNLTIKVLDHYINGMLPLIIDGTGKDYKKIKEQKEFLDRHGYDTYIVFVNSSLENSLKRNNERERSVPKSVVINSWNKVQENIGKFQDLFGNDKFSVVDNNERLDKESTNELRLKLTRQALKYLKTSIQNKIGLTVLSVLEDKKGLYKSDLKDKK